MSTTLPPVRWTAASRRPWISAMNVLGNRGLVPRRRMEPSLLFTNRRNTGVCLAVDRPSATIGIFPDAQLIRGWNRHAALIHELAHLSSRGRHGAEWRKHMERAIHAAEAKGMAALVTAIRCELGLYQQRHLTQNEVAWSLATLRRLHPEWSTRQLVAYLADGSGWSVAAFRQQFPWIHNMLSGQFAVESEISQRRNGNRSRYAAPVFASDTPMSHRRFRGGRIRI